MGGGGKWVGRLKIFVAALGGPLRCRCSFFEVKVKSSNTWKFVVIHQEKEFNTEDNETILEKVRNVTELSLKSNVSR